MTTKIHAINVFYSSDDEKIFPSIAAVIRQLRLLVVTWDKNVGSVIALKLHDTAATDFTVSTEMVEQIWRQKATVLTLIAPNVLLGNGMLTSAPYQQMLDFGRTDSMLMLSIYCEKVANADRLVPLTGGRSWFTESNGRHLSSAKSVHDEAADVVTSLGKVLEKRIKS